MTPPTKARKSWTSAEPRSKVKYRSRKICITEGCSSLHVKKVYVLSTAKKSAVIFRIAESMRTREAFVSPMAEENVAPLGIAPSRSNREVDAMLMEVANGVDLLTAVARRNMKDSARDMPEQSEIAILQRQTTLLDPPHSKDHFGKEYLNFVKFYR